MWIFKRSAHELREQPSIAREAGTLTRIGRGCRAADAEVPHAHALIPGSVMSRPTAGHSRASLFGHEEDMNLLRQPKEIEVERLKNGLRDLYTGFLEKHASMLAHYQVLREKDLFYQQNITRNEARIHRASEISLALQKQWTKTESVMKSKLEKFQEKKEQLSKRYWNLKCSTKRDKATMAADLENMVNASHSATERLEHVKDKLVKILLLSEICGKYERNDDKFMPYGESTEEEATDYENLDPTMIEECKDFKKMDKFLLKINRVRVQVLCLRAEKERINKENTDLKDYIKSYLTDLALNGTEQPRTAFSTESKKVGFVQRNLRTRPVTCIEGALSNAVLHERRMKLEKKNKEAAHIYAYPRYQSWTQTT
ncbi:Dynein regulatory complex subunit 2 [Eumeta japonica]|uniref:Dynein regulatory complex subunit 2 n=1 Tax=Eumeta variegata TaxID=151549 RepID=A0A4C1W602_EUMVA|nr:Dynein regulatory complex subunit 2 [Eumeta japonica]